MYQNLPYGPSVHMPQDIKGSTAMEGKRRWKGLFLFWQYRTMNSCHDDELLCRLAGVGPLMRASFDRINLCSSLNSGNALQAGWCSLAAETPSFSSSQSICSLWSHLAVDLLVGSPKCLGDKSCPSQKANRTLLASLSRGTANWTAQAWLWLTAGIVSSMSPNQ